MPSLTHQETLFQALELRASIDDLRSATYTVVQYQDPKGPMYMFVASFDLDAMQYVYTLADANFIEVKGFSQVGPEVVANFGKFVDAMLAYTKGAPHPYADNIVKDNPEVVPVRDLPAEGLASDHNITADEATLN